MEFGPGLGVSQTPGDDLIYYSRQPDGTFTYYCGYEEAGQSRITHAVVKDAYDEIGGVLIVNENFFPVQWLFEGLTVAVFDLPPVGYDPETEEDWEFDALHARHVAMSGGGRQEFTVNLNPGNLPNVLAAFERETGEEVSFAQDFLDRNSITSWAALVTRAQTPGRNSLFFRRRPSASVP